MASNTNDVIINTKKPNDQVKAKESDSNCNENRKKNRNEKKREKTGHSLLELFTSCCGKDRSNNRENNNNINNINNNNNNNNNNNSNNNNKVSYELIMEAELQNNDTKETQDNKVTTSPENTISNKVTFEYSKIEDLNTTELSSSSESTEKQSLNTNSSPKVKVNKYIQLDRTEDHIKSCPIPREYVVRPTIHRGLLTRKIYCPIISVVKSNSTINQAQAPIKKAIQIAMLGRSKTMVSRSHSFTCSAAGHLLTNVLSEKQLAALNIEGLDKYYKFRNLDRDKKETQEQEKTKHEPIFNQFPTYQSLNLVSKLPQGQLMEMQMLGCNSVNSHYGTSIS